ncbi:hypothetical protein CEXT_720121 [Caerostris extrusa]|uniref:Rhodanese domain-containing protein n=1 Tax=Caerostris extrusa TaxID=172846 RepID=A0AAV4T2A8_CAEEX|nr:hypothetical protein CEXT_720121 [Caerostris extrusa]
MEIPGVTETGNNGTFPTCCATLLPRCVTSGQALQDGDVQPRPVVTMSSSAHPFGFPLPLFVPHISLLIARGVRIYDCRTVREAHEVYKRQEVPQG